MLASRVGAMALYQHIASEVVISRNAVPWQFQEGMPGKSNLPERRAGPAGLLARTCGGVVFQNDTPYFSAGPFIVSHKPHDLTEVGISLE